MAIPQPGNLPKHRTHKHTKRLTAALAAAVLIGSPLAAGAAVADTGPVAPASNVTVSNLAITNPSDITVTSGEAAIFFALATSEYGVNVITWEESTDGESWTPLPGTDGATLTVMWPTTALTGRIYRATATNLADGATVFSAPATLTVTAAPEPIPETSVPLTPLEPAMPFTPTVPLTPLEPATPITPPAIVEFGPIAYPTITGGRWVGDTLTGTPGVWPEGTELKYQWIRGVTPIPGATGLEYTQTDEDAGNSVDLRVTGTLGDASKTVSKNDGVREGTQALPLPDPVAPPRPVGTDLNLEHGTISGGVADWPAEITPEPEAPDADAPKASDTKTPATLHPLTTDRIQPPTPASNPQPQAAANLAPAAAAAGSLLGGLTGLGSILMSRVRARAGKE